MAITYVPGKGWVNEDGGGGSYVIGGAADKARSRAYEDKRADFARNYNWNANKDYSDQYDGLFGGAKDRYNYSHGFGAGPNQNWETALRGRLDRREGGKGGMSHFEERTSTTADDYRSKMMMRNNAIEDMYRNGYDMQQIRDHVEGRVDIKTVEPSYGDYFTGRRESRGSVNAADAIRGITSEEPAPEFWGDDYFIGAPDYPVAGVNPITGAPSSPPAGSPSTGGGFMGGYNSTRPQEDSPIQPSENSFMKSYMDKREALANRTSTKSLFKDMIDHE